METQTTFTTSELRELGSDIDADWAELDEQAHRPSGYGWEDGESLRAAGERQAKWLGALSLALGVSQLAAPGALATLIGLPDDAKRRTALRIIGARELASAAGLFAKPGSASAVWSRVAGDAIDLALLGAAFSDPEAKKGRLAAAAGAVLGIAALDVFSAARLSRQESVQRLVLPIHVQKSITIDRAPDVVYGFWRDLENLPRFMAHLESVRQDEGGSVWRAKAPAGMTVEWHAEITLDRPNEAIAWRALEGASVPNRGVVRFRPGPAGRGTELSVELKYDPPGGAIGAAVAKLFGEEPSQQIAGDLRRLKQVLETGSVVHSDASIHHGMHPARPAAEDENTVLVGSEEEQS